MNKATLVEAIVSETNLSKAKVGKIIEAFTASIKEAVSRGERVTIAGFGTFYIARRKARRGVNPRTGQAMTIPAANVPKFRPGKALQRLVEGGQR